MKQSNTCDSNYKEHPGKLLLFFLSIFLLLPGIASAMDEVTPKRVLVCSVAMSFRHASIPYLHQMLHELAEADGRFTIVTEIRHPDIDVPRAPRNAAQRAAWTPEQEAERQAALKLFNEGAQEVLKGLCPTKLKEDGIDLVIFANTVGDLPMPDVDGFVRWIEEGRAFVGIHAATDTLKDTPRYTEMIRGIFDGHGPQVPATLHAGDLTHPANTGIGETWHLPQEEMYLIRGHDPNEVRTLWYMRHHPNHPEQEGHFPVSWCHKAGSGLVFYTSIGHRQDLMSLDPDLRNRINPIEVAQQYRQHVLAGILWALGFKEGSYTPNPEDIDTLN